MRLGPLLALSRRCRQARQSGQAVLELAIALSVMLMLVLGIVDFAPAVVRAAQLSQAAREGAAYARAFPTNTTAIRDRVRQSVPTLGFTANDVRITVTCSGGLTSIPKACGQAEIGDTVTVSATFTYVPLTGQLRALMGQSLAISRSATSEIF